MTWHQLDTHFGWIRTDGTRVYNFELARRGAPYTDAARDAVVFERLLGHRARPARRRRR